MKLLLYVRHDNHSITNSFCQLLKNETKSTQFQMLPELTIFNCNNKKLCELMYLSLLISKIIFIGAVPDILGESEEIGIKLESVKFPGL